uniref:Uncharacterized protein n=1 Tax=Arundo donax TaxID=35708 RepID=A0A0A9HA60_ARUDO
MASFSMQWKPELSFFRDGDQRRNSLTYMLHSFICFASQWNLARIYCSLRLLLNSCQSKNSYKAGGPKE